MSSESELPAPHESVADGLSVVKRLHDDYWHLVRTVEENINHQRFAQADIVLCTLGPILGSAYHFRQQSARLAVARGLWPQAAEICEQLLQINADDAITVGLLLSAWAEMGEFKKALARVISGPPQLLSADWALERLFAALNSQDKTGLELTAALQSAGRLPGRGKLWIARMRRLAGDYVEAEKLLIPLTRSRAASPEACHELALAWLHLPTWHRHIDDYKAMISAPDTPWALTEQLQRAVSLHGILTSAYVRGWRSAKDYQLPDSFLEVVFETARNPMYAPETGRVALVGATMAAGGAERVLGSAFVGLRSTGTFNAEMWLYSRNPALNHDFFLREMEIDRQHPQSCFNLRFDPAPEPFAFLPAGFAHNAHAVHALILQRRPAVLHAWQDTTNLECAFAGVLAGVPKIILHPHNMRPDLVHKAPIAASLRRGYRALLQRDDVHMVFVSEASQRDYLDWLGHSDKSRCHVVYNGFHLPRKLSPEARRKARRDLRRELGIAETATVVGGVFRFHKLKRPKLWLDTARSVLRQRPGTVFAIFGDGPEFEDAKKHAETLGISGNVRFAGRVTAADEKIIAFDLLLHTSETEGLPTVLIEAQAVGVPVVAFGTGGVAECVHPDFSIVCKGDGANEISAAVLKMLKRPPEPRSAAAASRIIRQRFSRDAMVARLEDIYRL